MRLALAVAMLPCGDDQCRSRAVAKDPMPAGQAQLRIDDDPVRVVSGAPPDRQLRVVGPYGSGTDEDCVGERPHAMAMQQVSLAGDPAGVAVFGRNSTVEALPDMSDDEPAGVRKAIGKIEVELHRDIAVTRGDLDIRYQDNRPDPFMRYVRVYRQTGSDWRAISHRTVYATDRKPRE